MHTRGRRQSGFTLIELMLTLVVLSIMAAALMPSPASWFSAPQHQTAAESVREAFEYARAQAMATGIAHRVGIELQGPSTGGVLTVFQGTSASCRFDYGDEDQMVRTVTLVPPNVEVAASDDAHQIVVEATASLSDVQPPEVLNDGVCIRPDGTVRNARFNEAFLPPGGAEGLAAGTVAISVQDNHVSGDGGSFTPTGSPLRVLVPYTGVARVAF